MPPLFGLAPGGVFRAGDVAAPAVRSCRTLSTLPAQRQAVCFLWHFPSNLAEASRRALPGTVVPWSPDFPRLSCEAAAARPSGGAHMGYCGRGSNSESNFARHSPSMMPSIRSGRKRRWKAITAFCASVTS